jgi:hypothetical protein
VLGAIIRGQIDWRGLAHREALYGLLVDSARPGELSAFPPRSPAI